MADTLMLDGGFQKNVLQTYIVDSNEAVEIKLVRNSCDIDNEKTTFNPDMSHQIFGETEQIFGYRGLKIKLYYSAAKLTTYLSYSYKEKINPDEFDGVKPDEIIKPIAEKIPPGYLSNLDVFIHSLDKDDSFKPFGDLVHRFTTKNTDGDGERVFEIYFHDISPNGFQEYHDRLQMFLLWFIDASSFIDTDDERWKFFLIYEKYIVNGSSQYAIAGYTTAYEYYAFPDNIRPRISQMIVFPPFQRMGLGAEMLQTIYRHYKGEKSVTDITVEDPSENFQRLRDFVDCRNCQQIDDLNLTDFKELTKEACDKIQSQLKLNKRQIRRVFEILKLQKVNKSNDEQYKAFRLLVKNRLNSSFRKEDSDLKKLKKVLSPEEIAATLSVTGKEQRLETLERLYKDIEQEYDHIVDKLNESQ